MKLKFDSLKTLLCSSIIAFSSTATLAVQVLPDRLADPIYVANQNPFVQVFGLPKAEAGTLTPKGKLNLGFLYFVSNNAIQNPNKTFIWDGETGQYNLSARYGIFEGLELGVDIPFIDHSGGYLDSLIRHYHDIFGFPNDRQEQFNKNQLHYKVDEKGSYYETLDRQSGLGDIRLSMAIPLFAKTFQTHRYLALRPQLKLPTGKASGLLGSGGIDLATTLAYSDYETLAGINTVLSAYGGIIYMGNTKVLRELQNHVAGYGGVSLAWMATTHLDFKLQLDAHSAFYDSDIDQLGTSMQLLAGGTAHLPGEVLLDLGISEQLVTDATPDVGFYLFIRHLF